MRTRDTELNKVLSRATLPDAKTFGDLFEDHVKEHRPIPYSLRNLIIGCAQLSMAKDPARSVAEDSLPSRIKRLSQSALDAGWVPEKQQEIYRDLIIGMKPLDRVNEPFKLPR